MITASEQSGVREIEIARGHHSGAKIGGTTTTHLAVWAAEIRRRGNSIRAGTRTCEAGAQLPENSSR